MVKIEKSFGLSVSVHKSAVFSQCNKLKIICNENSFIHDYADSNGLNYCIKDKSVNFFEIKNDTIHSYKATITATL